MKLNIKKYITVSIESRLFNAGKDEFGDDYAAESYHIMVRCDSGRIWYHPMPFLGVIVTLNEDGFNTFSDNREKAQKEATTLLDRVIARGYIETDLWYEGEPSYGSEYFRKVNRL